MTDDDISFPHTIDACLDHLRRNPDTVVAQGYVLGFSAIERSIDIHSMQWFIGSIAESTPLRRLYELMRRYQPFYWAVFRTDAYVRAIEAATCGEGRLLLRSCRSLPRSRCSAMRRVCPWFIPFVAMRNPTCRRPKGIHSTGSSRMDGRSSQDIPTTETGSSTCCTNWTPGACHQGGAHCFTAVYLARLLQGNARARRDADDPSRH